MANNLRIDLDLNVKGYKEGAQAASYATKQLETDTKEYIASFGSLRKQLGAAKKEAQNLAGAFAMLSDAEKQSEFGKDIAEQYQIAIEKAAELQDVMADTNDAIKAAASDTATWDALKEGMDIAKDATIAYATWVSKLTGNEEDLAKIIKTVTTLEYGFNAIIKLGNALQQQSAIMTGIRRLQMWAAAKAEDIATKAKNKNTAATVANTAAEKTNAAAKAKTTAATVAGTGAIKGATVAQRVFNAVAKANPYVLLATAAVTAATAITGYLLVTKKSSNETELLAKKMESVKRISQAFSDTLNSKLTETITKFTMLKSEYESFTTIAEKTQWIKENQSAFNELGIAINNVNDADKVLIQQSADVIKALQLKAEAAALYAQYQKAVEEATQISADPSYQENEGEYEIAPIDPTIYSGVMIKQVNEAYKPVLDRVNELNKEVSQLLGKYEYKGRGNKELGKEEKTQLEKLEAEVNKFKKQLQNIPKDASNFPELAAPIKENLKQAEKELKDYKIKIGLEVEDPDELEKQLKEEVTKSENNYKFAVKNNNEAAKKVAKEAYQIAQQALDNYQLEIKNLKLSEVDIEENELKAKLDKAIADWKLAVKNNDEAAEEAAREAVIVAQKELNEHNLKFKFEFNPDGMTKAEKDINKIFSDLNKNEKQYDISFLPDSFKDQAKKVIDKLNDIKDARQRLQDIIDSNKDKALVDPEAADAIQRAQAALAATDGEYQKLIADAEKFNQVSAGIKERQKDFESFKNTVSSISNVVGTFDSVVSSINSMTNAFEEGKNAWEQFMAVVQTAMSIMNAVITIMEIVNTVQDIMNAKKEIASTSVAAEAAAHAANATAQATETGTTTALAAVQTAAVAPAIALGQAMEKLAAANIFAAHSYIPFAGPAIAAGFVAMMEAVLATVGKLDAFAHGGIIEGNSYHGDKLLARVNSGEIIMNQSQQKRLLDIANGTVTPAGSSEFTLSTIRVQGSDLVLAIKNELKTTGKKNIL